MQLSPSVPLPGVPEAPAVGLVSPSATGQPEAGETKARSFADFLDSDTPAESSGSATETGDPEKSALMLAALLGQLPLAATPIVPTEVALDTEPVEQGNEATAKEAMPASQARPVGRNTIFFSPPCARAYGKVSAESAVPVAVTAASASSPENLSVASSAHAVPVAENPSVVKMEPVTPKENNLTPPVPAKPASETAATPAIAPQQQSEPQPAASERAGAQVNNAVITEASPRLQPTSPRPSVESRSLIARPARGETLPLVASSITDQPSVTPVPPLRVESLAESSPADAVSPPDEFAPAIRVANFAASLRSLHEQPFVEQTSLKKDFLTPSAQAVGATSEMIGIGTAKQGFVMPSRASQSSPSSVNAEKGMIAPVHGFTFAPSTAPAAMEAPLPVSSIRETIAVVVSAVEALQQRAEGPQQMVNLNLDVGAEKLGLRLELRDGVVHTTFQTNSTELRQALGQEWRVVAPGLVAQELTVAAPVFAATPASSPNAPSQFPGHDQPQQRGQPMPEQKPHLGDRPATVVSTPSMAAPSVVAPTITTSLLNAFA